MMNRYLNSMAITNNARTIPGCWKEAWEQLPRWSRRSIIGVSLSRGRDSRITGDVKVNTNTQLHLNFEQQLQIR